MAQTLEFEAVDTKVDVAVERTLEHPGLQVRRPETVPTSPMDLLSLAVSRGSNIDTIEQLAKLQKEMLEFDAKRAFESAMHQAQSELRAISADANNPQTHSRYATYARLDHAVRPVYSKHGLSVSFNTETPQPEMVRVIAYASHVDGHTRAYQIDLPADGKGAKGGDMMTKTHATGAAVSYGQRYLLKMIFNLAVGDIDDDDGNGASGESMQEGDVCACLDAIGAASDEDELKRYYLSAVQVAQTVGDQRAKMDFVNAKNKRWRELKGTVTA